MLSRREWITVLPAIAAAAQDARRKQRLEFFTEREAADAAAIAERIIPADETPGASDAGVVYFIDRALAHYFMEQQTLYKEGLAALAGFAGLTVEAQISKLKAVEKTPFFEAIRTHTVMGFLSDPRYGGNRDRAGWKAIGFQGHHAYEPPFGAYEGGQ